MKARAYARGVILAGMASAAVITLLTFLPPDFGGKGFVLFSWHPALMSFSFLGMMGGGMLVYVGPADERKQSRNIHRALQITAFVLAVLGLAAIMVNKVKMGKSIIPKTTHAWFGTAALVGTAAQAASGMTKYSEAIRRGFSGYKWHGDVGRVTFALGIVTTALGLVAIFSGWQLWASLLLSQCVGILVVLTSYRRFIGISYLGLGDASEHTPLNL